MHRVDLVEELKRENIFIAPGNNAIPTLKSLLMVESVVGEERRRKTSPQPPEKSGQALSKGEGQEYNVGEENQQRRISFPVSFNI